MSFTDQHLYRARGLEPFAGIGDVIFVLDQKGPLGGSKYPTPYFAVLGVEPIRGPAPHGGIVLYTFGAAVPPGYGTAPGNTQSIPEAAINQAIAANGGQVTIASPKILQQGPLQLAQ